MDEIKHAIGKAMVIIAVYGLCAYILIHVNRTAGVVMLCVAGGIHGFWMMGDDL